MKKDNIWTIIWLGGVVEHSAGNYIISILLLLLAIIWAFNSEH